MAQARATESLGRAAPDRAWFHRAPKWRVALLLAGLPVFIGLSTVSALGNVLGGQAPESAAQLTPTNGFALGRIANSLLRPIDPEAVSGMQFEIADYERPRDLAIEALLREPTDTRAAGVLSALKVLQGEPVDRQLNDRLLGLSRRTIMPQIIEIDRAARSGEHSIVLERVDQLLRVNPELVDNLMPSVVALLTQDGALPAVEAMLRREPEWRYDFWRLAAENPAALDNAVRLRQRFDPPRDFRERRNDEFLLQALANAGEWARAEELAGALFEDFAASASTNALRNGEFTEDPRFRPFDWRLFADGTTSAALQPDRGQMILSASGGASGVIASQLLRLDSGVYLLRVEAQTLPDTMPGIAGLDSTGSRDALSFALTCASDPAAQPLRSTLTEAMRGARVTVSGACAYHFFTIALDLPDSGPGSDFVLESIALTPAEAGE